MSEPPPPRRPPRSREKRQALREELYERLEKGDIDLASAVRLMRRVTGHSQARYAHLVGVSPRILIELERGLGNPTMKTIEKIVAPFGLELALRKKPRR